MPLWNCFYRNGVGFNNSEDFLRHFSDTVIGTRSYDKQKLRKITINLKP